MGRAPGGNNWFWDEGDRANAAKYLPDKHDGFLELQDKDCESGNPDLNRFKQLISNASQWAGLEQLTKDAFNPDLNPFPYDEGVQEGGRRRRKARSNGAAPVASGADAGAETQQQPAKPKKGAAAKAAKDDREDIVSNIAGFRLPDDFFQIHLDMVMRRFPNGADPQRTDGDIRGFISALRYIYGKNLWRLIVKRRVEATLASIGTLIAFLLWMWLWNLPGLAATLRSLSATLPFASDPLARAAHVVDTSPALTGVGLGIVIVALMLLVRGWIREYPRLTREFTNAIRNSCLRVRNAVERRFDYLRAMIAEMHSAIRAQIAAADVQPEQAERLSMVALWMSMRAEHIALFVQAEMWRIRRMEAWLRVIGYFATGATLVVLLAILVAIALLNSPAAPSYVWIGAVIGATGAGFMLGFMNRVIFREQKTGRNILKENLAPSIKPESSHTHLHELSAESYAQLLMALQNARTQHAIAIRQSPSRPADGG